MNLDRQLERRKAAYVHAIGDALHHLNAVDREAVLEDVEDHIDSALYDGPGPADMMRLEEILQDLGNPESYAADVSARLEVAPGDAKLCVLAPFGMVWSASAIFIAVPMMFWISVVELDSNGDPIEPTKSLFDHLMLALGWFGVAGFIGGPSVSAVAMSKIRAARGALYGLYAAIIGLYLIPLAILDVVLMYISFEVLNRMIGFSDDLSNILVLGMLVLLIYWNFSVMRQHHRKVNPVKEMD